MMFDNYVNESVAVQNGRKMDTGKGSKVTVTSYRETSTDEVNFTG